MPAPAPKRPKKVESCAVMRSLDSCLSMVCVWVEMRKSARSSLSRLTMFLTAGTIAVGSVAVRSSKKASLPVFGT